MTREVNLNHRYSLRGRRYARDPRAVRGRRIPPGYAAVLRGGGVQRQRLGVALRVVLARYDAGRLPADQSPVVARAIGLHLSAYAAVGVR